jgi:small GTP-binding protein
MQLWDTAGQERFHSLIPSYIKDSTAAVIVFDVTSNSSIILDANSFGNLNKWIDNVREVRGEDALIMIIGNKCDLEEERCVESAIASSKINQLGLTFMEVSAKTGLSIKEFFKELALVIAGGKKGKE